MNGSGSGTAARLLIVDDEGTERIVAEVVANQAEVRICLPGGRGTEVLLYAGSDQELGRALGVQLWADGNAYVEVNLRRDGDDWVSAIHSNDQPGR